MIIKHVPVKRGTGTVGRVINYVAKDKGRIEDYRNQGVFHNLLSTDLESIEKEFEQNYEEYAVKRSNGNKAIHCILSLNPLDRKHASISMMDDLVRTYLDRAFPKALAFATHHMEQEHWHSHVLVSANKVMSKEGTRLSKQDLKDIHQYMLDYMQQKYPQLTQGVDMASWGKRLKSEKAYYQRKRHPETTLTKDILAENVQRVFRASQSSKDFHQRLAEAGYRTYLHKGEVKGVFWQHEDAQKKMRFSRLGIDDNARSALDKQNVRLQELETLRSNQSSARVHEPRQMPNLKPGQNAQEKGAEDIAKDQPNQANALQQHHLQNPNFDR